ncbi:hypothetical protein [Streptomyces sp. SLBN-31]|uniref:hypothetical protein n=1 Tax=Streptomyces sp. SLBN-31 TaxID=2768444 RepID=UPI00114DABF3|nr:hypothetical protein [Streptomyces sp. SLBN-31]TQJ85238.1 hypothetical protein FBY22_3984 [Streptomyces sp. SLBN-31]
MAVRPSEHWRRAIADEARAVAAGAMTPESASFLGVYSESFLADTDAALKTFEADVRGLTKPSDEQVFAMIERVVLALNTVNEQSETDTFDTDEREQLCLFIDAVLTEQGIDVEELAVRRGLSRYAITDRWRRW